jgi:phenylpropionate dioxygenase-like ring-hydroxylating dioxygenase large terminal subunit
MFSKDLRAKPVAERLLGDDVVFFRANGRAFALANRCPHRGTPLSLGKSHFPRTLSCAYHGWTFDVTGQCVGALLEGPDAVIPRKARVRSYPVEERAGLIWVYMGEGDAPPVEEDVPELLLSPEMTRITKRVDWKSNWRPIVENFVDPLHALYLHRGTPLMSSVRVPGSAKLRVTKTADGKGVHLEYLYGPMEAEYPGLGKYPRISVLRRLLGRKEYRFYAEVRMPGYTTVKLPEEDLFFLQCWAPIDENRTRNFYTTAKGVSGLRQLLLFRLFYFLIASWATDIILLGQDQWMCESQDYGEEQLSSTDVGVIGWRNFARQNARGRLQDRVQGERLKTGSENGSRKENENGACESSSHRRAT